MIDKKTIICKKNEQQQKYLLKICIRCDNNHEKIDRP